MVREITLLLMLAPTVVLSQNRKLDTNLNTWWIYTGDHPIRGPWGVYAEVQARRSDFAATWQQLQLRDAATYRVNAQIQLSAGYVWTRTGLYGGFPASRPALEHRIYQQVTVKQAFKRIDLDHRYRLEQRWLQNFTTGTSYYWRYQDRFRYQAKVSLPVSPHWYLFGGDEIFLSFGPSHGPNTFDQNRAMFGIGRKISSFNKLETAYMHQYLLHRDGRVGESNHTLRVQWTSTVKLLRR
jgi:hypothetical protein